MYQRSRENVKVERGSTFTFTRGLLIHSNYYRKPVLRADARKYHAAVEIHLKFLITKDSLYIQHTRSFHCLYLFALHRINHYPVDNYEGR